MNPVEWQQITVTQANASQSDETSRHNLLEARSRVTIPVPDCEQVSKAVVAGVPNGWVLNSAGNYVQDKTSEAAVTQAALITQTATAGSPVTFTCVPPGNGTRIGVARAGGTRLDRD
jgi:hypothetical protein